MGLVIYNNKWGIFRKRVKKKYCCIGGGGVEALLHEK